MPRQEASKAVELPATLDLGPGSGSPNQRRGGAAQQAYPWLLGIATLLAGVFCYLYITKPVIGTTAVPAAEAGAEPTIPEPAATTPVEPVATTPAKPSVVSPTDLAEPAPDPFEETNLRIQHILAATGPDGEDLGRLTLEVPVLYESGNIRWTESDVAQARALLARIHDYQNRARDLRNEAVTLISEWDRMMVSSIPEAALRADSPTLPENQGPGTAQDAPLKSTEAIELDSP